MDDPVPSRLAGAGAAVTLALLASGSPVAHAVNADHGARAVSANPADNTPHVSGSVNAITQVGNKIIAAGTFTSVSPAGTFANTSDDVVRNRIFAFDASTGVIDASFNPNLGGTANSLDIDGTYIYVGGKFGSVARNTTVKRIAELTVSGAVVSAFRAVPNLAVDEVVVRGSRVYIGGAFTGVYDPDNDGGGTTNVTRFGVTADGTRRIAVVTSPPSAGRQGCKWRCSTPAVPRRRLRRGSPTSSTHNDCAGAFETFTRDVDFSPDGSWFAVTTTGAFAVGRQRAASWVRRPSSRPPAEWTSARLRG